MHRHLPPAALALSATGLIPFIGCGVSAVTQPDPTGLLWLQALTAYGAVILAFLGGVHWGLVLAAPAAQTAARRDSLRLALGVVPSLIGWLALVVALLLPPDFGLAILIAGFIAVVVTEDQLRRREAMPPGYMMLRWVLSAIVIAILVTVLTLRLVGARVIL